MFEPLRITAHLQTPVIADPAGYLPIDAILYAVHVREMIGEPMVVSCSNESIVKKGFDRRRPLPLKKIGYRQDWHHEHIWFYAASFAEWPDTVAHTQTFWTKRFDAREAGFLVDFAGRRGRIATSEGRYKGYQIPVFARHALHVRWYVVGDAEEIRRLLRFATGIGKKIAQGWGQVREWAVEVWPDDWSVYGPGGQLMRALPQRGGVLHGIRPSYWNLRHQVPCRLP